MTTTSLPPGLEHRRHLLPDIVDGVETTHPLTAEAAALTGLRAGTPVSLGYVDMVMTALGAGVHTGEANTACSVVGSTGVHLRAVPTESVWLNDEQTGYVIPCRGGLRHRCRPTWPRRSTSTGCYMSPATC